MRQTDVVYAPSLGTDSKLLQELFNKATRTRLQGARHCFRYVWTSTPPLSGLKV